MIVIVMPHHRARIIMQMLTACCERWYSPWCLSLLQRVIAKVSFHSGVCQLRVTVTWAFTVCKFTVFRGSCYQLLVFLFVFVCLFVSSLCNFEYSDILSERAVCSLSSVRTCNHRVVKQPKRRPTENAVCWMLVMCSSVDYFERHEASVCRMWQEQLQRWKYWSCWMWCCILGDQFLMFRRGILPSFSDVRWTRADCQNWLQGYHWEWSYYSPPRHWEPLTHWWSITSQNAEILSHTALKVSNLTSVLLFVKQPVWMQFKM